MVQSEILTDFFGTIFRDYVQKMASIRKTPTTNKVLFDTIRDLKKVSTSTGTNVFRAVAEKLSAPESQRAAVNISRIEKYAVEGETIIVPGKLLGTGTISKKVTVVAFSASEGAIEKITKAGGKFIEIRNYLKNKPSAKIRILG